MNAPAYFKETDFDKQWADLMDREQKGVEKPITFGTVLTFAREEGMPEGVQKSRQTEAPQLPRLDPKDGRFVFLDQPPAPRPYVVHGMIIAGKSAVLAALGGMSKTQLLMQMAICVALGLQFAGMKCATRCVVLLLGEEDSDEIARRFSAIATMLKLSDEQKALAQQRILAYPMNGLDMRLTAGASGGLESTGFSNEIIAVCNRLQETTGIPVGLIGLDHLTLLHGGGLNVAEDAARSMLQVNRIAAETGSAVLVLAHSPKSSISAEGASAADVAGSATFVNMARAAFTMRTMDLAESKRYGIEADSRSNYVALHTVKGNYIPSGGVQWFLRTTMQGWDVGILQAVELSEPTKTPKGGSAIETKIVEFVAAHSGQYTKTGFRNTLFGGDGPFRLSKRDLGAVVETLLADGRLVIREATESERKQFGHRGANLLVLAAQI